MVYPYAVSVRRTLPPCQEEIREEERVVPKVERTKRKPRQERLNRARVIEGALELIDEDGLDDLSMRRLAERLGVKPMTLYSHVANKEELLDGVVVRVLGEVELPGPEVPWAEAVRRAFASYRATLLRHPHVAPYILHRPARDAESFLAVLEYSLSVLARGGLGHKDALNAHRILTAFTTGLVMNELTALDPRGNTVLLWEQLGLAERFPNVMAAMPHILDRDIDETFRLGIDMILSTLQER